MGATDLDLACFIMDTTGMLMHTALEHGMIQCTTSHAQRVLTVRWNGLRLKSGAIRAPTHHALVSQLRSILLMT